MCLLVCSVKYEIPWQQGCHKTMVCPSGKGHGKNAVRGHSMNNATYRQNLDSGSIQWKTQFESEIEPVVAIKVKMQRYPLIKQTIRLLKSLRGWQYFQFTPPFYVASLNLKTFSCSIDSIRLEILYSGDHSTSWKCADDGTDTLAF